MLISVKNLAEARIAAASEGVSIIDVKDPLQGSLGFAGAATVNRIAAMVHEAGAKSKSVLSRSSNGFRSPRKTVSVALGELRDLNIQGIRQIDWAKISYAKVGLSGAYRDHRWRKPLAEIFSNIPTHVARVLVVYVDQIEVTASQKTLAAAYEDGMTVVLLDTFDKSQGNIFSHWSDIDCKNLFNASSEFGMMTVLAGSIRASDLAHAVSTQVDLIGVRGAVCESDRKSELSQRRLSEFVKSYSDAALNHCKEAEFNRQSLKQTLGEPG